MELVVPTPSVRWARPFPWEKVEVGEDGRTLSIYFRGGVGGCGILHSIRLSESPEDVIVSVLLGVKPELVATGMAARMSVVQQVTRVLLRERLGVRSLRDGAEPWRSNSKQVHLL